MAQLLLVEDDAAIRLALIRALTDHGHVVASAATGMTGLQRIVTDPPDLVVLDLGLPDLDGRDLLRMVRAASQVPIIVATARDDEVEIVRVLSAGADDYVVKPFTAQQLDARIRAVLRRSSADRPAGPVVVGQLEIDPRSHEAHLAGQALELTPKEFALLLHLAERAGAVVSRRELLTQVWRQPYAGGDKTVDVHLSWLRRKLGETAQHPRYLHTVRGAGIKLAAPEP